MKELEQIIIGSCFGEDQYKNFITYSLVKLTNVINLGKINQYCIKLNFSVHDFSF